MDKSNGNCNKELPALSEYCQIQNEKATRIMERIRVPISDKGKTRMIRLERRFSSFVNSGTNPGHGESVTSLFPEVLEMAARQIRGCKFALCSYPWFAAPAVLSIIYFSARPQPKNVDGNA